MKLRRGIVALLSVLWFQAGCAIAQTTQPTEQGTDQPTGLSATSPVDQILDALASRGMDLHTLSADVQLTDIDPTIGDSTARRGKFWLENLPGGDSRARVLFTRKEIAGRPIEEKIEYALANGKLIDRNYQAKSQVTRQILSPGEKMNLLKLGEGPFPLPIGQKRDDVHAAFDVTKVDPKKDDPEGTVHILLVPKPGTSLAHKFKTIDVWVNLRDQMPQRIKTLNLNESEMRQTDLSNVKVNAPLTDADLSISKTDLAGWNLTEEKFQQDSSGR